MAYKHLHGMTRIRKERYNNLSISWDYDSNPSKRYPVLLYTPNMTYLNNHHHIPLTKKQAKELKDWLTAFLKDAKKGFKRGRKK